MNESAAKDGDYCPVAKGAEIFAERWTPVIIRNLHNGCRTFTEIRTKAPGLSRTLLSTRLRTLERTGVVARTPKADGRGFTYHLTPSGEELWEVCRALGAWGSRWLESAPPELDPAVALRRLCERLPSGRMPRGRVVARFEFTDRSSKDRLFWLLAEDGRGEVCVTHPGFEEDVWVRTTSRTFSDWFGGRTSFAAAVADGRISVDGAPAFVHALPTWVTPD